MSLDTPSSGNTGHQAVLRRPQHPHPSRVPPHPMPSNTGKRLRSPAWLLVAPHPPTTHPLPLGVSQRGFGFVVFFGKWTAVRRPVTTSLHSYCGDLSWPVPAASVRLDHAIDWSSRLACAIPNFDGSRARAPTSRHSVGTCHLRFAMARWARLCFALL